MALAAVAMIAVAQQPAAKKAVAAPAATYKELESKYPPLREIQIPAVETHTLANGMRLYLLEDHTLPIIRGRALVRAGNLFDPPDKIGLADITGAVMRTGGTVSKPGDQLDQTLESMAASVETGIGETSGQASFFTLKEHLDKVLAIYADVIMHPAFRQERIDLYKNQTRSAIARRNDDAGQIAHREFTNLVYGKDTPYGWQPEYEHVDRIERADLERFYRRYFFPANIMLTVYGDFSAAEMKAKIEAAFKDWKNDQPPVPPFPAVQQNRKGGVYLVAKDDVNQTNIWIGHLGGLLKDEDYPALEVMSDILGGGFTSRLLEQVRTRLGFAYQVGARWGADYNHPGLFAVTAGTKSDSTVKATKAMLAEIDRIRGAEVTDAELATAKQTILNSFVFNFDTKSKTLNRLLVYEYWGYPKDFIFQYKKKLEAVTKQDVLRVAQKHLRPEEFTMVAVGKPGDFDQPLAELGKPVTPLDITIPQPKQERAKADLKSVELGRAALQRAQKAAGGADKLAALKDVSWSANAQLSGPMGSMAAKQRTRIIFPSLLRQENELPFGKIAVYTDGKTGWMTTPQGQQPLPGIQLQQVRGELFRHTETLLLSDRDPARTVAFVGKEKVGAREADVVEISAGDRAVTLYIDASTGELLKKQYQSEAIAGAAAKVEETYEDFREAGGLRVPFKATVFQNGQKFGEIQITELQYNSGLKPEDLAKP
jgi:predicted Zn-dependent peptidase